MTNKLRFSILSIFVITNLFAQNTTQKDVLLIPFGEGGQHKMIYDRRQRPQAVLVENNIHIVYNGGASAGEGQNKTVPYAITYHLESKEFTAEVRLPGTPGKDHHFGPIIWADNENYLHVLSGCHKTPGTHVISTQKNNIGLTAEDWKMVEPIAPSLSYPSVTQVYNKQFLMYYRVGEHRSSWTYSISNQNVNSWTTPENSIVDLNKGGEILELPHSEMDEASSYQTYLPANDGKSIHVVFMYYDDNKGNLPEKYFNPFYQTTKNLDLKYNLYYINVDLQNNEVKNFSGERLKTPVDLENANAKCKIWDTDWRGTGVPPDMIIDRNNNPAFLHVLTETSIEELNYYYVHFKNGEWTQSVIAPACHKWNSSHLQMDDKGMLHAYLLMDDGYFESKGKGVMNNHGGGKRIEEWISEDDGNTWKKNDILFSASGAYEGWRFNNIQPIKTNQGKIQDGMWLFYGWEEKKGDAPQVKAFLIVENRIQ